MVVDNSKCALGKTGTLQQSRTRKIFISGINTCL